MVPQLAPGVGQAVIAAYRDGVDHWDKTMKSRLGNNAETLRSPSDLVPNVTEFIAAD
jgi:hypothetical protein